MSETKAGNIEAIRDWSNRYFYTKDEINKMFINEGITLPSFFLEEQEVIGKLFQNTDIACQCIPFFKEGVSEEHWSNVGQVWTHSEINNNVIDKLFYGFIINQNQNSNEYVFGNGSISYNSNSENFSLNFTTAYNTWLVLIYQKPV